ncbi:dinP protein [Agrilactobacillus composti DSM 18527 = JCM 14202]|uniref:DNA polymerase IV n=2 Tax=Agrilactobacillus TaxID=2767875 RepID=A0A0R1XR88_9LACO|nr:dinP protein [Agrilactobacillus composti DSM 18527 = JCM 14202]
MLFEMPILNNTQRKIIHVDMDAFYASIEMLRHPELRQRPVIVSHDPRQTHGKGVVTTANYVARSFGIHSAMPAQKAFELAKDHQPVFIDPDFPTYRRISDQVHDIFHEVTDIVEPLALDEAYLEVTENKLGFKQAIDAAMYIQSKIYRQLGLTCSTGITYNKYIAKLASDYRKPFGRTVVLPEQAEEFLKRLPIEKFQGVGKKTIPKMHDLKVFTGADLYALSEYDLIHHFGKMGHILYQRVRGIDNRPVEADRTRKSVGKERTYNPPLDNQADILDQLKLFSQQVADILAKRNLQAKTVVLKMRDSDFVTTTKRITVGEYIYTAADILAVAQELWTTYGSLSREIRLLGVTTTTLLSKSYENMTLPLIF